MAVVVRRRRGRCNGTEWNELFQDLQGECRGHMDEVTRAMLALTCRTELKYNSAHVQNYLKKLILSRSISILLRTRMLKDFTAGIQRLSAHALGGLLHRWKADKKVTKWKELGDWQMWDVIRGVYRRPIDLCISCAGTWNPALCLPDRSDFYCSGYDEECHKERTIKCDGCKIRGCSLHMLLLSCGRCTGFCSKNIRLCRRRAHCNTPEGWARCATCSLYMRKNCCPSTMTTYYCWQHEPPFIILS